MSKYLTIFIVCLSLQSCDRQCTNTECFNNGSCYEGQCLCEKWYSGDQCELMFNRNYDGVYLGSFSTSSASLMSERLDSIVVIADDNIPNRLNIENSFYYELVSDTSIIIPSQRFYRSNELVQVEGYGSYNSELIKLSFIKMSSSVYGQVEESIIFTGVKN